MYICSAVTRLQSLIGSLLNFATLDHTPLAFGKIDLKSMLEAVLGDFKNDLSEAQASVEVTDLPQIEGSEVQLQEVFHNLIGNALKYRRPDTPLNISISAEVAEEVLVDIATVDLRELPEPICTIKVTDNGTGIRETSYERIFRPFERLVSYEKVEGSGLGLAIVSRIVERHKGSISVESTLGEGTTFIVKLPVSQ